ncbi:MAG: ParB/RepB/Spo0J family partition protein [Firmicutes bacterium]|nr:ParB/RepB/Spo0J family partition protein [Bacillota bacterium]
MSKRIGRGLSELLASIEDARVMPTYVQVAEVIDGEKIYYLDIANVKPNPDQPRKYFGPKEQKELEDSIRTHGIIQPLICVKKGDSFQIVAGERRYRAGVAVGLATVPAIVKELTGQKIREISLIENLQREDLNPIEEAEALKELSDMYSLTQEDLAGRIGKARSSVANTLRLLALQDEVKDLVRRGRLSSGHARTLVPIEDISAQVDFAYKACDNQMSVRELEQKVKFYLNPHLLPKKLDPVAREKLSLELKTFADNLKRVFSTKVKIVGNETKGRISIDYFSKEDLQRIYDIVEKMKK